MLICCHHRASTAAPECQNGSDSISTPEPNPNIRAGKSQAAPGLSLLSSSGCQDSLGSSETLLVLSGDPQTEVPLNQPDLLTARTRSHVLRNHSCNVRQGENHSWAEFPTGRTADPHRKLAQRQKPSRILFSTLDSHRREN